MLKNAYLDAEIGVDPAENEPAKNLQHFANFYKIFTKFLQKFAKFAKYQLRELPRVGPADLDAALVLRPVAEEARDGAVGPEAPVGDTTADRQNFGKTLLVFGCIGSDFCKKICVRQHFSKSTRFSS